MGVTYNIAAKPTYYEGVRFRSRLEATWAAFFDLLHWPWEYEPLDLKGWVPDFVLQGVEPIAVEVKPIMAFADFPQDGFDKMNASGWTGRILITGTGLRSVGTWFSGVGWLADNRLLVEGKKAEWRDCLFTSFDGDRTRTDIATVPGERGFIFGGEIATSQSTPVIMKKLWNLASNKTAWRR